MITTWYEPPVLAPPPSGGRVQVAGTVWEILSSDGRTRYPVRRLPDGRWTCPCKGFGYRDDCRHVAKAQLLEAGGHGGGPV